MNFGYAYCFDINQITGNQSNHFVLMCKFVIITATKSKQDTRKDVLSATHQGTRKDVVNAIKCECIVDMMYIIYCQATR